MYEILNKKITIADVIVFLEKCFAHGTTKDKNTGNVICDNLSNFEFLDINLDMPDVNLEFQDIVLDFNDVKFVELAA